MIACRKASVHRMTRQPAHELERPVAVVANNLRVDAATIEVVRSLTRVGIRPIVLKGPAVARWLYSAEGPRFYGDCDLLLARSDLEQAASALLRLGFVARDDRAAPDWGREHASEFERADDAIVVDLHTTLPGVRADDTTAWRELSLGAEAIAIGGGTAHALGLPGRALHVALHSAQHGIEWKRPLEDLERAIAVADESIWVRATDLAHRLDAVESFAAGLRLTESGSKLAARLGLPRGASIDVALRAATAPPIALGLEELRTGSWRDRVRLSFQKLFPPPAFMRRWRPIANRGRLGMAAAYMYRPIWLLIRAPQGIRAWREARRSVRGRG
jgi:hypothetical protein